MQPTIEKLFQNLSDPGDCAYMLVVLGCVLQGDREGVKQLVGSYLLSSK